MYFIEGNDDEIITKKEKIILKIILNWYYICSMYYWSIIKSLPWVYTQLAKYEIAKLSETQPPLDA